MLNLNKYGAQIILIGVLGSLVHALPQPLLGRQNLVTGSIISDFNDLCLGDAEQMLVDCLNPFKNASITWSFVPAGKLTAIVSSQNRCLVLFTTNPVDIEPKTSCPGASILWRVRSDGRIESGLDSEKGNCITTDLNGNLSLQECSKGPGDKTQLFSL